MVLDLTVLTEGTAQQVGLVNFALAGASDAGYMNWPISSDHAGCTPHITYYFTNKMGR